ncbi:MAG: PIN domain-containing protein [Acidobacteriaceae bacterium]|nr:PIN domain-containing protein [Acidobacteriaceae bacterium]
MSDKNPFFDTNVLVYAHSDDLRKDKAERLIEVGGRIGVQQLNEFVSVARRKLRRSWTEVLTALDDLQLFCPDPVPITLALHEAALRICERYEYSIYDSLVIAAALEASCDVLYTEDMRDGQRIESIVIRNPFSM